jgi:hypothetical protein
MPVSISCPSDDRDAGDRRAYEQTRNPLFVIFAIGRYAVGEPLPEWIRRYWLEAIPGILAAAVPTHRRPVPPAPADALQEVLRSLGFVRGGWNAFREFRRVREYSFEHAIYELHPARRVRGGAKIVADDLAGVTPGGDGRKQENRRRGVRRRVAKARKILG